MIIINENELIKANEASAIATEAAIRNEISRKKDRDNQISEILDSMITLIKVRASEGKFFYSRLCNSEDYPAIFKEDWDIISNFFFENGYNVEVIDRRNCHGGPVKEFKINW